MLREHYPGVVALEGVKLGTYGAILQRAALLVSNDTGPGHLAAAVGAPVISVLGPTKPEQWAPWGPTVSIVQLRQSPETIAWPTPEQVMDALEQTIASRLETASPQ
jgi:heptosyltransferase-2